MTSLKKNSKHFLFINHLVEILTASMKKVIIVLSNNIVRNPKNKEQIFPLLFVHGGLISFLFDKSIMIAMNKWVSK
jgi:hypothetical protein